MPQHDYEIANASGSAVRADINAALLAIVSNNSSSSEPSTKYAYMLWADTTNGILKMRNAANDGWVEILQLDGTLTMEDGAEATPGLAFRDDLNTGIWSSANNKFNISTGGTERLELGAATVFNESGADVDFRIEGDTEVNLFYVDAGNDRIGIGTNAPQGDFEIEGDATGPVLTISGGTNARTAAGILMEGGVNASDNSGIWTKYSLSIGCNQTNAIASRSIDFNNGDTGLGSWLSTGNLQITDGDLVVANGHGISFYDYGTGSTISSNLLDDYEKGVFTPVIGGSSNPTQSYAYQRGSYVKIGNLVHVSIDIQMASSGVSAGSGSLVLDGLPFNKGSESSGTGSGQTYGVTFTCGYSVALGSDNPTDGYMSDGDDHVYLLKRTGSDGGTNCSATAVTNNTRMIVAVTYRV